MLPPPSENARVVARSGSGDWAAACARAAASASVLKDYDRGTVWRASILGRDCVVKCTLMKPARRRIQAMLRLTPAWRHWHNARWLRARGFAAGEPLTIVRGRASGGPVEALVVGYVEGRTALAHLARGDLPPRAEHAVAGEIGRLAARLAHEGRFNRDAKLSNLVVTSAESDLGIAVIDCADLRRCRRGDRRALVRMLASGAIEPVGCGVELRRTLRMRAVLSALRSDDHASRHRSAKSLWRDVATAIKAHGDPRPRDNPLD